MNNWFTDLFTHVSITQTVIAYGIVIAFGIWLGRIKFFGISLGVTWVLFVGMILSYFGLVVEDETLHFLREFGLVLFVYSIGLQVGPGFFASLKKNALTNNLLAASIVILGVIIAIILKQTTNFNISEITGVMSGAVTNTPGLGAAQSTVQSVVNNAQELKSVLDNSTMALAYALAYPFGVFGIILVIITLRKLIGTNLDFQRRLHEKLGVLRTNRPISIHLELQNQQLVGHTLKQIFSMVNEPIVVSRMLHNGEVITPSPNTVLEKDDVLLIVTPKAKVEQLMMLIGPVSHKNLKSDEHSKLISRTIVVTRGEVTHKRLGDLAELHHHDCTFTRLSRAGIEMVPHGNLFLQLGDNVKVVGTEEEVAVVSKALGNELKRLEHPEIAPIFIGIVLGCIVGSIPFYIPNLSVPVKIGMAGGPLIVALILSRFGSVFYLNNYTTHSANLMLREIGICFFLASVGLKSGSSLGVAFATGNAWWWMLMGVIITLIPLLIVGYVALKFFKRTYFEVCGLLAGASTDPPALAFALKTAGNDIPAGSYATVYPLTMILRIVAAQLLILFFV